MKKILVVSGTRAHRGEETMLSQSLTDLKMYNRTIHKEYDLKIHTNNSTGLSSLYNQYINEQTAEENEIALFVHDDVYIDDAGCFDKLRKAIATGVDIVGLAGGSQAKIQAPTLWHLMCDKSLYSGAVSHTLPQDQNSTIVTSFGPYPRRCVLLDGLFLAVNLKRAIATGWKFNESFQFHHYDLASCLDANAKKLKLSTWNIHVVHRSLGLWDYNGAAFQESEKKFLETYRK